MRWCYSCMRKTESENGYCPLCGKPFEKPVPTEHLLPGTMLNDKIIVGYAIGQGGFGITYIGYDTVLDMRVAIKEYFPTGFASRVNTSSHTVFCGSEGGERKDMYDTGKDRFLREARILARFSGQPGIVDIFNYFEDNGTAYIVMEYLEGETLKEYIKRKGLLTMDEALELLRPVMSSLDKIHSQNLIHRDISPDNIMLVDGRIKLLDFGAARDSNLTGKSLSIMLKPGFAPEEQYRSRGIQGPWTDIYALCATMYKCITGLTPDEAPQRLAKDELKKPSELNAVIGESDEAVLMKGMSVHQEDRYQDIEDLLAAFDKKKRFIWNKKTIIAGAIAAAVVIIAISAGIVHAIRSQKGTAVGDAQTAGESLTLNDHGLGNRSDMPMLTMAIGTPVPGNETQDGEVTAEQSEGMTDNPENVTAIEMPVPSVAEPTLTAELTAATELTATAESTAATELTATAEPTEEPTLTAEPTAIDYLQSSNAKGLSAQQVNVGGSVFFGSYEQDENISNGKEAIEWIVLEKTDDKALLLSKYVLDRHCYGLDACTWENSELRDRLNNYFLNKAFSSNEQESILTTLVVNTEGNDTYDKVFALSEAEVKKYWSGANDRRLIERCALATDFVKITSSGLGYYSEETAEKFIEQGLDGDVEYIGCANWLLRTSEEGAWFVSCFGSIECDDGYNIIRGIRPAVWVSLADDSGSEENGMITPKPALTPSPTPSPLPTSTITPPPLQKSGEDTVGIESPSIGSYIKLGTYRQTSIQATPIEWLVLDIQDGRALLLSKYVLAVSHFSLDEDYTWENSYIRKWLNETFYDTAFSEKDKKVIEKALVTNKYGDFDAKYEGNDTYDNVFLLSLNEVKKYWRSGYYEWDTGRQAKATDVLYIGGIGVYTEENYQFTIPEMGNRYESIVGNASWYLRSPGTQEYKWRALIDATGCVNSNGNPADTIEGIRPAIWVKIN